MGTAKLQWHDNYNFIEPVTYSGSVDAIGWSDDIDNPSWWSGWHDIWTVSIPKGHIFSIDQLTRSWTEPAVRLHVELYVNGSLVLSNDSYGFSNNYGSFGNYTSNGGTTIKLRARMAVNGGVWTGQINKAINWTYTTGKEGSEDL